jgi:hypothetical protein
MRWASSSSPWGRRSSSSRGEGGAQSVSPRRVHAHDCLHAIAAREVQRVVERYVVGDDIDAGSIINAVAVIAKARGVGRAQVALAWLRRNPVVAAPLVGATKPSHLDDAVASLHIELTEDEVARLEAPYTPRYDFQGISDDADLARISARLCIKPAGKESR